MKVCVRFGAAALTAAALAFIPCAANASTIVYDLLKQDVRGFTATGTITTDGATGILAASDITGFDITVSGFGTSGTLMSLSDLEFVGTELSTTSTWLSFDFSGSGGEFGAVSPTLMFCFADPSQVCGGSNANSYGEILLSTVVNGFEIEAFSSAFSGNDVIATAAPTGVPEPSTWALLLAGIFGAGAMARYARRDAGKTVLA